MAKQTLDNELVDSVLTAEVFEAIERAERRGVAGERIFGTLQGVAIGVAVENKASFYDVIQVADLCMKSAG